MEGLRPGRWDYAFRDRGAGTENKRKLSEMLATRPASSDRVSRAEPEELGAAAPQEEKRIPGVSWRDRVQYYVFLFFFYSQGRGCSV